MVSFSPGSNRVTAFISLTCDREVEGNEEFDLALSIVTSNAGVTVGSPSRATAIITDSTGKTLVEYASYCCEFTLYSSPGRFCQ